MKDYTIYSEEEYYDRIQLLNIYSPTVCDCIWEEVLKYREQFRYEVYFQPKRSYITLNKTLFQKMLRIYDLKLVDEESSTKLTGYENECHNGLKSLLLKYISVNQLVISQQLFQFLLGDEFLLLKVYILYDYLHDLHFLYLFLSLYNRINWYNIIIKMERKTVKNNEAGDITSNFRDFLDLFYFLSTNNMIQLSSTTFEQKDIDELLTLYPTCNEKQMSFYLKFAQRNHYYTISQYMKTNEVSYETARKAMEHLVELGFYHKIKIGKKFVFTPVD